MSHTRLPLSWMKSLVHLLLLWLRLGCYYEVWVVFIMILMPRSCAWLYCRLLVLVLLLIVLTMNSKWALLIGCPPSVLSSGQRWSDLKIQFCCCYIWRCGGLILIDTFCQKWENLLHFELISKLPSTEISSHWLLCKPGRGDQATKPTQ